MNIAFQGVPGANSDVGIRLHFPDAHPVGYDYSEQVFDSLVEGEVDLGFVPIENSIMGNVDINADLIYRKPVAIIGEYYVPIRHCLLGLPGTSLQQIERVYSHPVALEQCRPFIQAIGAQPVPDFDTAGAARALAHRNHPGEAAIAPALCAELYGLEVLQEGIQQVKRNITRFVAIVTPRNVPLELDRAKTSLAFVTRHEPGALVRCLEQFSLHGINLTRLESRPIPENPFEYVFYVDFIGSTAQENVRQCLAGMSQHISLIKILGSYPVAQPPR